MVPGQDRANCFRSAHGLLPVPDGAAVGLGLLPHQQIPAGRLRSEVMSDRIYMSFYAASCKLTSCRDAAVFRFSDESSAVARDDLDRFFARFQSLGILSYQSLGTTPGISTDMGVD